MAVPAEAIARFRRLKGRADDLRAALGRVREEREQLRDQIAKVEIGFRQASRGRTYVIGNDGELYQTLWHEEGEARGDRLTRTHSKALKRVEDEGAARIGKELLRLRRELGDLEERRAQIEAQAQPINALVEACRAELNRRGWHEDGRQAHGWARPVATEGAAA